MKTLKDVKVGETATVARLHGEGPVKRRIMDMGITKGVQIYVRKVAPLGDPMELTVRDGVAEKIVDEYGSLQELMDDICEDPERLGDFGVNNPAILADSLYRMKGTKQGNA